MTFFISLKKGKSIFIMKYTFCTLFIYFFSFSGFCQETVVIDRRNDVIIDLAVGSPNAGSMFFYKRIENLSLPVQLGARVEYMVNNKIGLGLEVNYEKFSWEKSFQTTVYSSPPLFLPHDTTLIYSQTKTRFLARFVYHFCQTKHFDIFFGSGLGFAKTKWVNKNYNGATYDPHFSWLYPNSNFEPIYTLIAAVSPYSYSPRFFLGTHILFTENIGMLVEVGLGSGSILDLGLSVRF